MKEEPKPWEFRSKPSWQRLIIMLGGVTVNFILAAVIYILMAFVYGSADIDAKSVVGGYEISNPVLNEIGLETGDKIVSINGEEIEFVSEIRPKLIEAKTVKIERDGNLRTLNFPVDFLVPALQGSEDLLNYELHLFFLVLRKVQLILRLILWMVIYYLL